MKTSHILSLLALSGLLASCATPKSDAQLRKAYFKTLPEKNAELDTLLSKRGPANCEIENGEITREAQPLIRIPPILPQGANTSGSCEMQFNINKAGKTVNIETLNCMDDIYDYASRRALSRWVYNPRIVNGEAAAACGIETKITFRLMDERGDII